MVDGNVRDLASHARTVSEALAEARVGVGPYDAVEPATTTALTGVATQVRVVRALPTTVIDGGVVVGNRDVAPGSPSVMLASLDVPLASADTVTTELSNFVSSGRLGQTITITRGLSTGVEEIPAPVKTKTDKNLAKGQTKVEAPGAPGQKQVTYRWAFEPGTGYVKQVTSETVLQAPVTRVVIEGAKVAPAAPATLTAPIPSGNDARALGYQMMLGRWGADQWGCLETLWNHESGWRTNAGAPSRAYGIPQSYPGSKMASAGSDWLTNPATQISWGLGYIAGKYGSPCAAWSHWQVAHSY